MKALLLTAALVLGASAASAGDVAYVKDGCTHTPILGASGSALYWNLGLEAACGRDNADGGSTVEIKRAEADEDK